jgi:cell division protein FtsZ
LIQITCGPEFSLKKAEEIASMLTYNFPSSAHTRWTLRRREDLKGRVRVIVIITGIQSAQSYDSINY